MRHDVKIWLAAILYGLAAGIISYISILSYEDQYYLDWLAFIMNYPTFIVLFSISYEGSSFVYPLDIIGASVGVWSLVGLAIYGFVKMLKLGP
ncbi:MAG: hypothetical protein ABI347_08245 [Nitrososphaera sp.]